MTLRNRPGKDRSPPKRDAIEAPTGVRSGPRLDSFAHGPLNEIVDRFRTRLIEEAARIAGGGDVDANHLELACQRLLASSPSADWNTLNRRRVYLIRLELTTGLSAAEAAELESLQAEADRHMAAVSPRPLELLWDMKRELSSR
jgi:hypothetical protein